MCGYHMNTLESVAYAHTVISSGYTAFLAGAFSIYYNTTQRGIQASQMHDVLTYTLYLRCEDTILAIPCTGLPITATIADKRLNNVLQPIISQCKGRSKKPAG